MLFASESITTHIAFDFQFMILFCLPGGGGPDDQVPGGDALQGDGAP